MNRRNFLQAMLAASMAPAICRAENLMKIYVPSQKVSTMGFSQPLYDLGPGDFTIDGWVRGDGLLRFMTLVQTVTNGVKTQVEMLDGVKVETGTLDQLGYYKAGPPYLPVRGELDSTQVDVSYDFLMNSFDPCFTKEARSEESILQGAKAYPFIPPKNWLKA